MFQIDISETFSHQINFNITMNSVQVFNKNEEQLVFHSLAANFFSSFEPDGLLSCFSKIEKRKITHFVQNNLVPLLSVY